MNIRLGVPDTIAWRIALTVGAAIMSVLAFSALFDRFAGPSSAERAELVRADDAIRMIEAAPAGNRQNLADTITIADKVFWYPPGTSVAQQLVTAKLHAPDPGTMAGFRDNGLDRRTVIFTAADPLSNGIKFDRVAHPNAYFMAVQLRDNSWVLFIANHRRWGDLLPARLVTTLASVALLILAASMLATYFLARPIRQFAEELRQRGGDPRAGAVREAGPKELRAAIAAFNSLQAQLRKFVDDRTLMLAAISHDLRTPLTKIRLRGEFIDDEEQRVRLFRDVDDLQAMADSALSFFRDDYKDEEATAFDFAGLLRTIADDYSDQGAVVRYAGPERFALNGRPFSLRRACMNLVDNAVKWGGGADLELTCNSAGATLTVSDRGPGIPSEALEKVFSPFFRVEQSRNRSTGGMGLGLTSALAVVRAHAGDIVLRNRQGGGLTVCVTLPAASKAREIARTQKT
ncbi:Adaptive-response sensory-kinase SasA [Paraburkholderia hiiakae]|uniref:histidine kinase n=1 Tax=Paraburkholderia hiiakae TaxID=1081782 RepID=A0ABM8NMR9_9BURK|nr:ATP-binding protein [Paraburkholderia hiiakae]CAD6533686.1 Adaptive-response sensory-kinase SasA [Paraburkholderia hiiakae]